jgi:hypothetical protein
MMSEIVKTAAYNQIDDVIEKLRMVADETRATAPNFATEASTRLKALMMVRNAPAGDPNLFAAYKKATSFLQQPDLRKMLQPGTVSAIDSAIAMTGYTTWQNQSAKQDPQYSITVVPGESKDQPGVIVVKGLFFGDNAVSQKVRQTMGDWVRSEKRANGWGGDTYVRATKEAWTLFKSLAPLWLDNLALLDTVNMRTLPAEAAFGGTDRAQPKQQRHIQVALINFGHEGSVQDWELGKKNAPDYNKKGIRITFPPDDDFFFNVQHFAVNDLKLGLRTSPHRRQLDIYDLSGDKLVALSNQMQGWKYSTVELNQAIAKATGKTKGTIQEKVTNKVKSAKMSVTVINNGINKNMQGYELPPRQEFGDMLQQRFPNAFDPAGTSPKQVEAQKDGIYFALGRQASVLADEPGFGKTVQAQIAAELACKPGQKVLVITPAILISENWTNPKQGPIRFLGHTPEMIRPISSAEDFDAAVADPQVKWVIIPRHAFGQRDDQFILADKIKKAASQQMFGALLLDEFQQIKSLDSDTFRNINRAVDAAGIKHRIGMTGTPADNDPSDLYTQLRLLRHPLLYQQDGVGQQKLRQTEKGFANQFLGGEAYEDDSSIAVTKIDSVFRWARELTPEEKVAILRLFATTFIRREKADVRDDLPPKNRTATPVGTPEEEEHWNTLQEQYKDEMSKTKSNRYATFLRKMALSKVHYTVARALEYLNTDPQRKIFIVSKYPEAAQKIEAAINEKLGDGSAAAVVGGSDGDKAIKREIVPQIFKQEGGALPGKQFPLRAAVYTMQLGSVGLNFGVAGKCLFNDLDWNPSTNLQAEDRVHRITNTQSADIEYLYLRGTYEEQMWQRVQKKQAVNHATMTIMRQAYSAPEEQLVQLANSFVLNLIDSLLLKVPMTPQQESYLARKKEEFLSANQTYTPNGNMQVAAKSWYGRYKTACKAITHIN